MVIFHVFLGTENHITKMSKRKNGEVVSGKVVKITSNGVILSIGYNETAFLHISEISNEYIENIEEVISKNDKLSVEVIEVKGDKTFVSLKKMTKEKVDAETSRKNFEEKIQNFLKVASENQKSIQKTHDRKRNIGVKAPRIKK